jgi:hypothetical protein
MSLSLDMIEVDPVSKYYVFWYLEFQMMVDVQKPSNSECYTP